MEGFGISSATPLTERETTKIFMNSLKGIYHDKMLGNATKNFVNMVVSGELIESSIKNGLVEDNSSSKKTGRKKKEKLKLSMWNFSQTMLLIHFTPVMHHTIHLSTMWPLIPMSINHQNQ